MSSSDTTNGAAIKDSGSGVGSSDDAECALLEQKFIWKRDDKKKKKKKTETAASHLVSLFPPSSTMVSSGRRNEKRVFAPTLVLCIVALTRTLISRV